MKVHLILNLFLRGNNKSIYKLANRKGQNSGDQYILLSGMGFDKNKAIVVLGHIYVIKTPGCYRNRNTASA